MKYSKEYIAYRDAHPECEVCSRPTMNWPHHIRTRKAGGTDAASNLLALCGEHHGMIHSMGVRTCSRAWVCLQSKILAAIEASRV